jgi:CxxC-x17-CxxC domain-containing protein
MQDHRDDHIVCADCGTSFLFSAGEAQVFAERGLASPKRCKECRRARKERSGEGGLTHQARPRTGPAAGAWNGGGRDAGPPRGARPAQGPRGAAPRQGPPRYTGDVNEYRSPMQDRSFTAAPWQPAQPPAGDHLFNRPPAADRFRGPRPSRQGGPGVYRDAGEHRAPSSHGSAQNGFARTQGNAPAQSEPARRRPQAEMFSITCDTCGVKAEVPFKPAEGREVFCPSCYRARKPV